MIDMTPEQIVAKSYSAAMDSVNLINAGKPVFMAEADWADMLQRNKDHLLIQLDKETFYEGFDMAPLKAASA